MTGKIQFMQEFRALASRLNTYPLAGEWMRLAERVPALTPSEAAAWADLGFLPSEAAPQVLAGLTAETYREVEKDAERRAGGPDRLAAMRIAEILAAPGMLGPGDVTVLVDPFDERQEIVILPPAGQ